MDFLLDLFINMICYYSSYFGSLASTRNSWLFYFLMLDMYSGQIILFASQDILLFFHVGIRINPCLFTFMYMGWE